MFAATRTLTTEGSRSLPSPHRVTPSSSAVCRAPVFFRCAARDDAASHNNKTAKGRTRTPHASLILIGGRGCGKSALCKRLVASDPRFDLRVLDDMIVEEAWMSIPKIVN